MHKYIKTFATFMFVLAFLSSKAQNCNCGDNLKFVIERVKKNYVGYTDKVTISNRDKFQFFTDSLLNEARKAQSYQCSPIIRLWLSFFNDKHMSITYDDSNYSKEQIRNYYANEEKLIYTEPVFRSYLSKGGNRLDGLEGIWRDHTGAYEIGIIKDQKIKNEFIGFILKADGARWTPQQVKFRFTKNRSTYLMKYFKAIDHSKNLLSLNKIGDTLTLGNGAVTSRWYKSSVVVPQLPNKTEEANVSPMFKVLDDKTCLFQMPEYATLNYVSMMDSIIKKNAHELETHDHLIIDLRNNYGGSVLVYDKLIPYVYTKPILTEGASVLATEENIRDYYSQIPSDLADSVKRMFESNLRKLKAHPNELYPLYPVDTITISNVRNYPKRVSLITNGNTASAAELFILEAKQSSKVKIYGSNSSGAIDYLEVVKTKLPCGFYSLGYPACKSLRLPAYPLDNIGIKPDIFIPASVSDWIDFVRTYKDR
ncbi:S41 family peptidase [Pedobacter fastidiosus]|nr:S41 family peptidase [Pedobacter fastidiosus]